MKAIVCIVGIIAGGRLLVRPLYRRISALKNSDVFAATTLLVVLGTSVLTQAAGLSLALGAFLVRDMSYERTEACSSTSYNESLSCRATCGAGDIGAHAGGRPVARPKLHHKTLNFQAPSKAPLNHL